MHSFRSALFATAALAMSAGSASALSITQVFDASNADAAANTLIPALLAPASGITVVGGSAALQGNIAGPDFSQTGTYSGFNLAPSSGSTPTLVLQDGIFLTSGTANIPLTNTVNSFDPFTPGSGSNAALSALSVSKGGTSTINDANMLSFNFTVDPGATSVSAQFVFGTDEFPTQSVTDIFGFFVDGVNYAEFPSGELISNTPGNPTNFISNPVGGGLYDIEYNGLTQVFTVTGVLDPNVSVHTIMIGVADTSDSIFDSGVFITGLKAGVSDDGGITPETVPEPATMALFGTGLLGLGLLRRRRRG
jgi:hypothetical protein